MNSFSLSVEASASHLPFLSRFNYWMIVFTWFYIATREVDHFDDYESVFVKVFGEFADDSDIINTGTFRKRKRGLSSDKFYIKT